MSGEDKTLYMIDTNIIFSPNISDSGLPESMEPQPVDVLKIIRVIFPD